MDKKKTMTIGQGKRPQSDQNLLYSIWNETIHSTDRPAYTRSTLVNFARLLARICSTVNCPPQTLQRQPGDAAGATIGPGC